MNAKTEPQAGHMDTVKMAAALALVVAAVVAFYYFEEQSQLVRVIGLLIVVGIATAIMLTTTTGSTFLGFYHDSRTELRKVVWPTRQETIQTSLIVILLVFIMGIFLWLLDMFLFWLVRLLTG